MNPNLLTTDSDSLATPETQTSDSHSPANNNVIEIPSTTTSKPRTLACQAGRRDSIPNPY